MQQFGVYGGFMLNTLITPFCENIGHRLNRQDGTAIAEFAITLPVILILLGGLLALGRLLGEITWVAQSAYHTAMLGAEKPALVTSTDQMTDRLQELYAIQQRGKIDNVRWQDFVDNNPPQYDTSKGTVKVDLNPRVLPLAAGFEPLGMSFSENLNFYVSVTAPMLISGAALQGPPDQSANPARSYDCKGNVTNRPVNSCYGRGQTICTNTSETKGFCKGR